MTTTCKFLSISRWGRAALIAAALASAVSAAAGSLDVRPSGAGGDAPATPGFFMRVIERTAGLASPIGAVNAGDSSGRMFIVEQGGRIRIWTGTQLLPTPFLDVSGIITGGPGTEQGLLGLAFHPNYETNGFFYINYTCNNTSPACSGGGFGTGDAVVARYQVSPGNPNVADPASARTLFVVDDPFSNHNGGNLAFGPDGYLYVGLGDGGSGDDQCEYAQNLLWDFASTGGSCVATSHANHRTFWGKMLRIDVNQNVNTPPFYGIPASNPYTSVNDPSDLIPDEIWAYGLRNPWRYSFDRLTGDLYVGDVGQVTREEFTFLPAPLATARNFGWDVLEGFFCHEDVPAGSCNSFLNGGSLLPALDYPRSDGSTIIGGYVYRGRPRSLLFGTHYVFGDLGSGHVWHAFRTGQVWQKQLLFDTAAGVTSFGEDERGGLYFVGLFDGRLYQIVPYSFQDVPPDHFAWRFVEPLFEAGVTGGCGGDNYCPDALALRGEMAVFLLRTFLGPTYMPPACTTPTFSDVPCSNIYAAWIYDLVARGVTAGCGNGQYCPNGAVTREQMSVLLLRTKEGASYVPPACTTPTFSDVPCSSPFARWVEELVRRGITGGCGQGNYCPANPVSRGQMAVFLVTTFGLVPI